MMYHQMSEEFYHHLIMIYDNGFMHPIQFLEHGGHYPKNVGITLNFYDYSDLFLKYKP